MMYWWNTLLESSNTGPFSRTIEIVIKARQEDEVIDRAKQEAAQRCPGTTPEDWILKSVRIEK